jgi:hypothetical protein
MIHRDVVRLLISSGIVSVGCAVFGWTGLFSPESLGWPPVNPWVVKILLAVLGCMPILWFLAFRLHLRSFWVYRNTKPIRMNVGIEIEEDNESTRFYALLTPDSGSVRRIPVYPPRWNPQLVAPNTVAQVFIDPVSGKPLVVEIDGRRLWTMAP